MKCFLKVKGVLCWSEAKKVSGSLLPVGPVTQTLDSQIIKH